MRVVERLKDAPHDIVDGFVRAITDPITVFWLMLIAIALVVAF